MKRLAQLTDALLTSLQIDRNVNMKIRQNNQRQSELLLETYAESAKVLSSLRGHISEQLKLDTTSLLTTDGDVEENLSITDKISRQI